MLVSMEFANRTTKENNKMMMKLCVGLVLLATVAGFSACKPVALPGSRTVYLFEGTATSAAPGIVSVNTANWVENQWVGYRIQLVTEELQGQFFSITKNTEHAIFFDSKVVLRSLPVFQILPK